MSGWRILLLALWLAAPAVARAKTPIVVPPAPTIVASPPVAANPAPTPAMPDAAPLTAPPPGLVQTPAPQAPLTPGATANADNGAAPATAPVPALAPVDSWAPATSAQLGVLNVVDGSVSQLRIPVGGQVSIGDLKVSVLACLRRPPGQVPDAAAFIDVQADTAGAPPPVAVANAPLGAPPEDTGDQNNPGADDAQTAAAGGGPPAYRGWMVRSMPAAMVVGDASETFRVIDCS